MVEALVREEPPDYEELERLSREYITGMRRLTRVFSILLFAMPLVLLFVWIMYIENVTVLLASVLIYLAITFMSIYTRYVADRKYRDLDCSLAYYIIHSDASVETIRISALVLGILLFVLLQTLGSLGQDTFFVGLNLFIILSLVLSIFSPRFRRYERRSAPVDDEILQKVREISDAAHVPPYILRVIPERKMKVANAYCAGILKSKIFITDYLVDNLEPDEAACIIAHELGHATYRHNLKSLGITFFFLFASAALFFSHIFISSLLVSALLQEAGILLFIFGVPAFVPSLRRRFEIQADLFASWFFSEETAVNALLKTNYLNLTPLAMSGGVTHPPLAVRISRIREAVKHRRSGIHA